MTDIIILIILAVLILAAIIYSVKHRSKCCGCDLCNAENCPSRNKRKVK